MTQRFLKVAVIAGLSLPVAAHAQDLTKPVVVPVSLPWKVNCHGLSNVLLTADALQALPLHLVTNLSCDQGLAVISDPDAYTVNVRTGDGKSGYMAAILMKAPPAKPAPKVQTVSASTNNGVARWRPGAKGCDEFTKNGVVVESLTANDVTVQVSLTVAGIEAARGCGRGELRQSACVCESGGNHAAEQGTEWQIVELSRSGAIGERSQWRNACECGLPLHGFFAGICVRECSGAKTCGRFVAAAADRERSGPVQHGGVEEGHVAS